MMRIDIICAADIENLNLTESVSEMLKAELIKDDSIIITNENPDVIHIIGGVTHAATAAVHKAKEQNIALVYTPLTSLSPWQKPSKKAIQTAILSDAVIASGTMECELLTELLAGQSETEGKLTLIPCPVLTSLTSVDEMLCNYLNIYTHCVQQIESRVYEMIDKRISDLHTDSAAIQEILRRMLFATHQYRRQALPKKDLTALTAFMTTSNYDEHAMSTFLMTLNIHTFVRRLEYVMKEQTGLTEGFMPIPFLHDKEAENMMSLITDYI